MMQIRHLVPFVVAVCATSLAIGQQDVDEANLAKKLELLGAFVERDENRPEHPVVHIDLDRAKRFNKKYIHLLQGFKRLESIDLGSVPMTSEIVDQIEQPQVLANLLMNTTLIEFDIVFPRFERCAESGIPYMIAEIENPPISNERTWTASQRERPASRKANAAIALIRLHHANKAWSVLKYNSDPRARSYLIDRLQVLDVSATELIDQFHQETDSSIRQAFLLSLGEYQIKRMPGSVRKEFANRVKEVYQSDRDSGMHACAEWLLRQWDESRWLNDKAEEWREEPAWRQSLANLEKSLADPVDGTKPKWYVNSQGQEIIVIPGPVTFMMGSSESEPDRHNDEKQHRRQINRTYCLSATTVTVEQFQRFEKNDGTVDWAEAREKPVVEINWDKCARYCNWLSEREGLEPCYTIDEKGVSARDHYLMLSGYRFPTEAELEYATRAGTTTSRYYGETEELLPRYAWYRTNSDRMLHSVGRLKPNDFGFFDLLGNVFVWCQDPYEAYRTDEPTVVDKESIFRSPALKGRVLRGGSFSDQASYVRSAYRYSLSPNHGAGYIGIRLARTIASNAEGSELKKSETDRK